MNQATDKEIALQRQYNVGNYPAEPREQQPHGAARAGHRSLRVADGFLQDVCPPHVGDDAGEGPGLAKKYLPSGDVA